MIVSLCLAVSALTAGTGGKKARKGRTLPAWSKGCLDIHAINTGRGECTFIILPDGTTMAIDAGEFSREGKKFKNVAQKPNAETRPTTTFARYMKHFLPKVGCDSLDMFITSHFHMDHMGNVEPEYVRQPDGGYVLTGPMAIYELLPFREAIDRAYGAYDSLRVKAMSVKVLEEYKRFLAYRTATSGLKASMFELGSREQLGLRYDKASYPTFSVENICSNGYVWENGVAVDVYEGGERRENAASCGFVIRYGDFDYLTAGDIGDYHDLEYRVAKVAGDIDAVKAHHHLSPHSMCAKAMAEMRPEVMVATSFYQRDIQPDKSKFDSIVKGGCRLYCTNIDPSMIAADEKSYGKCSGVNGHVVIRVMPGGKSYYVYMLDDTDERYRVKQVDGPFKCK